MVRSMLRSLARRGLEVVPAPLAPLEASQLVPVPPREPTWLEQLAVRSGRLASLACTVCGARGRGVGVDGRDLRESIRCEACGATNRQRQMGLVLAHAASALVGRPLRDAADVAARAPELAVYNTEAQGPLHRALAGLPHYRCSEYLGPALAGGTVVDGVQHQDLQALSYADASLDLVLTSDVLEHVPDPYRAHCEILRVLRPGGRHVFTVPFHQTQLLDETRARLGPDGQVEHLLEPIYHLDPVRPQGVLVFTIFSFEMLVRLTRLGFDVRMYRLYVPAHGILGGNALVFEAIKPRG